MQTKKYDIYFNTNAYHLIKANVTREQVEIFLQHISDKEKKYITIKEVIEKDLDPDWSR